MSSSDYDNTSSTYSSSTESAEGVSGYDREKGNEFFGMVLKNKYFLVDKIGVGTFSAVWLAVNIEDNNIYAIKIQHVDDYTDGKDEAKLLAICNKSKSPNVPHLVEYFDVGNPKCDYINLCMVMDLCLGSVKNMVKSSKDRKVPFDVALKIISDMCSGIEILNKHNCIHTDIKLSNILIAGLNPVFAEFKAFLTKINFSGDLTDKCRTMYSEQNLDKLEQSKNTNTKIYKDKKHKYSKAVKNMFKKANEFIIAEFKKICNKYVLPEYQESTSKMQPSYYKRNFMFGFSDMNGKDKLTYILSDLGGAHKMKKTNTRSIQPRAYRAPEVIFECPWGPAIDMWSVGCLFYELLTGEQLFNPTQDLEIEDEASDSDDCEHTKHEYNVEHLCWIYDLVNINFSCFNDGKQYKNLCTEDGKLECLDNNTEIEKSSITEELNSKTLLNVKEKLFAIDILTKMITGPKERIKPSELISLINNFISGNQKRPNMSANFVDPTSQLI